MAPNRTDENNRHYAPLMPTLARVQPPARFLSPKTRQGPCRNAICAWRNASAFPAAGFFDPAVIEVAHDTAGAGVIHVPKSRQYRFRILLLGNHAQAVHFQAVPGRIVFRRTASRERQKPCAVEGNRGILQIREIPLVTGDN